MPGPFAAVFPPRSVRSDRPGAAAIVTRRGETLFRAAYGAADIERGDALDPSMTFRIGSLTKQFTAVAILLLVEEGRLSFADELGALFDGYPAHGAHVTVEQLLTHTSGIRSYTDMRGFAEAMATDVSVSQLIDYFKDQPLQFAPGARFAYSNSGYALLGAIIERVSGAPYADFLAQRLFAPLGMRDTACAGHERSSARRAQGYNRDRLAPAIAMSWPYAAGALVSTVDDLAKWNAALAAGRLLSAASWTRATTPHRLPSGNSTGYGYGFVCGRLKGRATLEHRGGIPGFSSVAIGIPQEDVFVAVLSNDDRMNIVSLLAAILRGDDPGAFSRKLASCALDSR